MTSRTFSPIAMSTKVYTPTSRKWYDMEISPDTGEATAYLYDDIGGHGITAKSFIEDLGYLKAGSLSVRINSYGGEIDQGVAIYNYLKQYDGQVTVYIDGMAASIASVIAMAGDKVVMGEAALMFIHNPWTMIAGDSATLEKESRDLAKRKESLMAIYRAKIGPGIDDEMLSNMMDDETLMTAEEAVDLGFADEVMESKPNTYAYNAAMQTKVIAAMAQKQQPQHGGNAEMSDEKIEQEEQAVAEASEEVQAEGIAEELAEDSAELEAETVEEEDVEEEVQEVACAREEFKRFVAAFGSARGAEYFGEDLAFEDAQARYMQELRKENEELKNRVNAVEQVQPVRAEPTDDAPARAFTRQQIASMSSEEYNKHRQEIYKAAAEGRIQ